MEPSMLNMNEYKIDKADKKDFKRVLKKVCDLKHAKIIKKETDTEYIYNVKSRAIRDIMHMMLKIDRSKTYEYIKSKEKKKYMKLFDALVEEDANEKYIDVKYPISMKDILMIIYNDERIIGYLEFKDRYVVGVYDTDTDEICLMDMKPNKISCINAPKFNIFEGFMGHGYILTLPETGKNKGKFQKDTQWDELNKHYLRWVENNYKGKIQ